MSPIELSWTAKNRTLKFFTNMNCLDVYSECDFTLCTYNITGLKSPTQVEHGFHTIHHICFVVCKDLMYNDPNQGQLPPSREAPTSLVIQFFLGKKSKK